MPLANVTPSEILERPLERLDCGWLTPRMTGHIVPPIPRVQDLITEEPTLDLGPQCSEF